MPGRIGWNGADDSGWSREAGIVPGVTGTDRNLYLAAADRSFGCVDLTVETFELELTAALANYDRHIVCIEKVPEECVVSLRSLMDKAIKAYMNRGPELRHGIALDRHLTIILSQTDGLRPLCGIYFNLHSPYAKKAAAGEPARD